MTAYDTPEQIAAFDVYIKQNPDGRQVHHTGTLGYEEDEWSAFQSGWNAAAQAEREACALMADDAMCVELADQIRARVNK